MNSLECRECDGSGRVGRVGYGWKSDGEVRRVHGCDACDGSGQVRCTECRCAAATTTIQGDPYCHGCAAQQALLAAAAPVGLALEPMSIVAWRLVCRGEPKSGWGNFDHTVKELTRQLTLGARQLRLQSLQEVLRMGGQERREWWLDMSSIAALYRWMVDHHHLDASDVNAVEYYLRHPYEYGAEWALMTTGQMPTSCPTPPAIDDKLLPPKEASG
jgi:hypothetical protein